MASATASRSASSKTMTGALPPSSRWSRLTRSAATLAMCLPVSVSPVTEIIPTFGCADERVADRRARAGDDVEHAGRQDLGRDLGQDQGGQRGPCRRLEDDRVAGRERRSDLPAGHHDRVVPRGDRGDHADRLAPDHRGVAVHVLVGRLALHHPRGAGEEAQVVDDDRDLVDRGADRLAGVLRLEAAELVGARLDGVGELEEHAAALGGGRVLPGLEGGRGGVRGTIDVLGAGCLDLGDDLAVGRVLDIERLARRRIDPFAPDELLIGLDALEDVGHRSASWAVVDIGAESLDIVALSADSPSRHGACSPAGMVRPWSTTARAAVRGTRGSRGSASCARKVWRTRTVRPSWSRPRRWATRGAQDPRGHHRPACLRGGRRGGRAP